MRAVLLVLLFSALVSAQQQPPASDVNVPQTVSNSPALVDPNVAPVTSPTVHAVPASSANTDAYTLAPGTRIAIVLKHAISTKSARENDPVYAETSFPVVSNGHIVIPVGTYVQGVIQRSQRPGRVKGRGELIIHFNSLIFPSGYTLLLPGAIDSVPGEEKTEMKDRKEGSIESQSTKGKDAGTIATTAGTGAAIGAVVARSAGGAATGGLLGAGVGLATVLLTRGPDVRIESGTLVDMVLERAIVVEHERVGFNDTQNVRIVH
jgi:type IV secretion system protein VirB10